MYTISLPPELALKAETWAKRTNRTMSELFRESFRVYDAQETQRVLRGMQEAVDYAATRNPKGYTEEDVPRLIQEVRAETAAEKGAKELVPTRP